MFVDPAADVGPLGPMAREVPVAPLGVLGNALGGRPTTRSQTLCMFLCIYILGFRALISLCSCALVPGITLGPLSRCRSIASSNPLSLSLSLTPCQHFHLTKGQQEVHHSLIAALSHDKGPAVPPVCCCECRKLGNMACGNPLQRAAEVSKRDRIRRSFGEVCHVTASPWLST